MASGKKRVLVVDDSVFARRIISDSLSVAPDLEVVGFAADGLEALAEIARLRPDVVTLDVEMPRLDGLETLRRIMRDCPTPVVMISSLTTRGARESIRALGLGAVDVMAKPHGSHSTGLAANAEELIARVRAAASVDVGRLSVPSPEALSQPRLPQANSIQASLAYPVVVIASSTGGPRALRLLMPQLDLTLGAAYVIVQHLPDGFSQPMAQDLDTLTALRVREAAEGDVVRAGEVLVAPSGVHCVIQTGGKIALSASAPVLGVRPAADVTMVSAASVFGRRLVGVVLTGMGRDGANGLRAIKEAGGATLAEDESSCAIYGMPRAAIESGCVDVVAPIERMGDAIASVVRCRSRPESERRKVGQTSQPKHRSNQAA